MKKIISSDKIYVSQSKIINGGRGVFAGRNIKKAEIIEICPIIEVPKHDMANLNESILVTYFFYFGKKKERLAVMLGFGSLYNHSYSPNARYKLKQTEMIMEFSALKDIKMDEEITYDYKYGNPNAKAPLWFE
jgi:uncharacterized protein